MSSFDINGPSAQPMVTGSQNLGKDGGGGGNTGYMHMKKKKKGKSSNEDDDSVFLEDDIQDSFEISDKKNEKGNSKFLGAISKLIKNKNSSISNDSFEKSEKNNEQKNPGSDLTIQTEKRLDPFQDDEFELADDDDYYNNIDV